MEHCSKPLTSQSQALAEKAEKDDNLSQLDGELYCECRARVGAVRKPWLDGPNGGPLRPTTHYPKAISRKPENPSGKANFRK